MGENLVIACYRLVSTLRKRVTKVACQTSELLDTQGKQRADAAFGLNDPPRAWIGLQLATPPQDPHVGAAVVRADARRRVERARPHWLVIDEAHQLLPSEWDGFA